MTNMAHDEFYFDRLTRARKGKPYAKINNYSKISRTDRKTIWRESNVHLLLHIVSTGTVWLARPTLPEAI